MMMVEERKRINFNLQIFSDNKFFLISVLVLLLGKLIGSVLISKIDKETLAIFEGVVNNYINTRVDAGFIKLFFKCFLSSVCYCLLILFSSFGVVGIPTVPIVLLFKGISSAVVSGILYRNHSLYGIAYSNLILLPPGLIADFTLVFLASKCFELSLKFASLLKDATVNGSTLRPKCVQCFRSGLISVIALTVASLVEAALTVCFIKFFHF